ncbi:MAG: glycine cleavage system aminomethyltransferase GcvT [Thiohalomonadaceae bacterium]
MENKTPLYAAHVALGAKIVNYAGWQMPIHYGSQIEEHHHVRRAAGMFDVSHMGVVDINGSHASDFLRYLLANDVARLKTMGKAVYSCMLNERGGVIDDLIVYYMSPVWFRMVVNAGNRSKDIAWLQRHAASFGVEVELQEEQAIIAVQGPQARAKTRVALGARFGTAAELSPFMALESGDLFIARTGYTGEEGFEIMAPAEDIEEIWHALYEQGVHPCGLGARDTLRLEAGLNLYGQDMTEDTTPLVSGLSWTVAFEPEDRQFIGRAALEAQRSAGVPQKLIGLVLEEKGILRNQQAVFTPQGTGVITSGSFSPTIGRAIALARVPVGELEECEVEVRGKRLKARVVKPPFVRKGQSTLN